MNVRTIRKLRGLTQKELAALCDVDESTISNVESGKRYPSFELMLKMSEALNVTVDDLIEPEGSTPSIAVNYVSFPVIGEVAAGYDCNGFEDWTNGEIDIPESWLHGRSKDDYFVLRVSGDSMFPTYQNGDIVLVRRQNFMDRSGQIGVVIYDDDKTTIKRVEFAQGEDWVKLSPINPQFPPIMIKGEKIAHFHVSGVPKMVIRKLD